MVFVLILRFRGGVVRVKISLAPHKALRGSRACLQSHRYQHDVARHYLYHDAEYFLVHIAPPSLSRPIWEFPKIGDPNIVPFIVDPKIRYPDFRKVPYPK